MDTHKKIREHISALSDGELAPSDLELALAALQSADGHQAWNTYHRIGDVLRAQATPELSDAFAEKLAERLAAEPAPGKRAGRAAAVAEKRRADSGAEGGAQEGGVAESERAATEAVAVTKTKPAIVNVS